MNGLNHLWGNSAWRFGGHSDTFPTPSAVGKDVELTNAVHPQSGTRESHPMDGKGRPQPPQMDCAYSRAELAEFYRLYRIFKQDSRDAMLRSVVMESSRISIYQHVIPLARRDFEAYLLSMSEKERAQYLRKIHGGYEFSRLTTQSELAESLLASLQDPGQYRRAG